MVLSGSVSSSFSGLVGLCVLGYFPSLLLAANFNPNGPFSSPFIVPRQAPGAGPPVGPMAPGSPVAGGPFPMGANIANILLTPAATQPQAQQQVDQMLKDPASAALNANLINNLLSQLSPPARDALSQAINTNPQLRGLGLELNMGMVNLPALQNLNNLGAGGGQGLSPNAPVPGFPGLGAGNMGQMNGMGADMGDGNLGSGQVNGGGGSGPNGSTVSDAMIVSLSPSSTSAPLSGSGNMAAITPLAGSNSTGANSTDPQFNGLAQGVGNGLDQQMDLNVMPLTTTMFGQMPTGVSTTSIPANTSSPTGSGSDEDGDSQEWEGGDDDGDEDDEISPPGTTAPPVGAGIGLQPNQTAATDLGADSTIGTTVDDTAASTSSSSSSVVEESKSGSGRTAGALSMLTNPLISTSMVGALCLVLTW